MSCSGQVSDAIVSAMQNCPFRTPFAYAIASGAVQNRPTQIHVYVNALNVRRYAFGMNIIIRTVNIPASYNVSTALFYLVLKSFRIIIHELIIDQLTF